MKKIKLMTVIAMAGLVGMTARAVVSTGLETVNIKLTILTQGTNTETSSTTKFNVHKVKVTNKDILKLIAQEFTNLPAITNKGTKLALNGFFSGDFVVLDKTNGIILANASSVTNADSYNLSFDTDNEVDSGVETDSKEVDVFTDVAFLDYASADDNTFFDLQGLAVVKETFADKSPESFKFGGSGDGAFHGTDAVVIGTASGAGKDVNDD
jgi:hypothetical protein